MLLAVTFVTLASVTPPLYREGGTMGLRAESVAKARKTGICTQCLKNKAEKGRNQCNRCIDTNRRKRLKNPKQYAKYQAQNYDRKVTNPLRKLVSDFAIKHGICTKCFGRKTIKKKRQCETCLERERAERRKPKRGRKRLYSDEERLERRRESAKRYKAKKKYTLSRKRSQIRSAVDKKEEL